MPDIQQLADIDDKFIGVNSRLDPSNLEPGYVAYALNRSFDRGTIKNRWGVVRPSWGGKHTVDSRTITASSTSFNAGGAANTNLNNLQIYSDPSISYVYKLTLSAGGSGYTNGTFNLIFSGGGGSGATGTFVVSGGVVTTITLTAGGQGYTSTPTVSFANSSGGSSAAATVTMRTHKVYGAGARIVSDGLTNITLNQTSLNFNGAATIYFFDELESFGDILGVVTYKEPVSNTEMLLVAVDEVRTDGGRGAVYAIKPGQSHRSIFLGSGYESVPMNGHDIYTTVRMIQSGDGVVMLRQGLPRYYFKGDAVSSGSEYIQLNCTPDQIETGDKVLVQRAASDGATIGEALFGFTYFARKIASNRVELYNTEANALASPSTTGRLNLTAASSSYQYYIECIDPKSFWTRQQTGNAVSKSELDNAPLILQANETESSSILVGFNRLPSVVSATSADTTTDIITAPNHRFAPGESVTAETSTITGVGSGNTYYVAPQTPDTFKLYTDQTEALADSGTSLIDVTVSGTCDFRKTGVAGGPMPNCREGIYFGNRMLGVFGKDFLAVGDISDPLTYLPLQNEFKLNSGSNDKVVAIYPFNAQTIIVFKERSILAIENLYGDLSSVSLSEITREYGCVSAKSIASTGSDILWLSQRGVCSIGQTQFGISQSVILPVSDAIQDSIDRINWSKASNACAAYFDNKYLLSVSTDGDDNNTTLVYNFLSKAWDGEWEGSYLKPTQYERINAFGREILVFTDASGFIHQFDSGALKDRLSDGTAVDIATSIEFRGYTCSSNSHKQWTDYKIGIEAWNPTYSVSAAFDTLNDERSLRTNATKYRISYYTYGVDYWTEDNTNDDFNEPQREDYSLTLPFISGNNGVRVNIHAASLEKMRLTGHSSQIQPKLTTSTGSVTVMSSEVYGIPFRMWGKADA